MLKEIYVENFRSLINFRMEFNEDITMLVGENDSGKTSVIDAIKMVFKPGKEFKIDDFTYEKKEALIEIRIKNKTYIKKFRISDEEVETKNFIRLDQEDIDKIKEEINSNSFNELDEENQRAILFETVNEIGIEPGRAKKIDTLMDKINARIIDLEENDYTSEISQIPNELSIFFLDGKLFKNLDDHIEELYFGKIKKYIWKKRALGSNTIENMIDLHLQDCTSEIEQKMEQQGSIKKLREYVPNITKIKITPNFRRNLSIGCKVDLLEGENVIPFDNKGDGTKRRVTMALLEIKNEIDEEDSNTYIFDEPNTHLHVKAELDLLKILRGFIDNQKQVIITTHSPFLLNSVNLDKVKLLNLIDNMTVLSDFDSEELESVLNSLGISNTNAFFSKKLLIVEGDTECIFVPKIFKKIYNFELKNILVRIINGKGIDKSITAARLLRDFELVNKNDIYIMIDNDGNRRLKRYINEIDIPNENKREIGFKEFEDTFIPSVIYEAWKKHVKIELEEENPKALKNFEEYWSLEAITIIKKICLDKNKKFSEKLLNYSREVCLIPMEKPDLGRALAKYVNKGDLDPKISYILHQLKEG